MTQAELAHALGTHAASISQVERGVRGLTVQQVVRLSRALKVSTDAILGEEKRGEPKQSTARRNPQFLHRLDRIQELPAPQRRAVLKILDGLLSKHGNGRS